VAGQVPQQCHYLVKLELQQLGFEVLQQAQGHAVHDLVGALVHEHVPHARDEVEAEPAREESQRPLREVPGNRVSERICDG